MLTQPQIERLWDLKMEAEARSLYFADIASFESTVKRYITGGTFVLGSAVLVTLLSHLPNKLSIGVTAIITLANGYQIAVNQESKIKTAGKLHLAWAKIECEYDQLWSHTSAENSEKEFLALQERERDLSETGATEIGFSKRRWNKWWKQTCDRYPSYHVQQQSSRSSAAQAADAR